MIEITIINDNEEDRKLEGWSQRPRIDVVSLLKLKPDKLHFEGFYFSGAESELIKEYCDKNIAIFPNTFWSMNYCTIKGSDTTIYKDEEKVKNSIKIKKYNRFELMDI